VNSGAGSRWNEGETDAYGAVAAVLSRAPRPTTSSSVKDRPGEGLQADEYGLFKGHAAYRRETEQEIYAKLGPTGFRRSCAKRAARSRSPASTGLPHLVDVKDIRGDLQDAHSATDEKGTPRTWPMRRAPWATSTSLSRTTRSV